MMSSTSSIFVVLVASTCVLDYCCLLFTVSICYQCTLRRDGLILSSKITFSTCLCCSHSAVFYRIRVIFQYKIRPTNTLLKKFKSDFISGIMLNSLLGPSQQIEEISSLN